jgi:hypothetical protein
VAALPGQDSRRARAARTTGDDRDQGEAMAKKIVIEYCVV